MHPRLHAALLAGTGLLASAALLPAAAQQAAAPAPSAPGIWTIQEENASVSLGRLTDRYYTNGLRLSWTSPEDKYVPRWVQNLGRALYGPGTQRVSINVGQSMFTSDYQDTAKLQPGDWPNSAQLLVTGALIQDTRLTRNTFALSLGVTGPLAQGKELQNGFHDLIGQAHNNGWGDQLHNEPAFEILNERVYRYETGKVFGLETDALPELTAGLGNVRVYLQTGATFRIGQGLMADYGVPRVRPGLSGGDAYKVGEPLVWYVFFGADGQAVAHDMAIDGNTFQPGPSARRNPFVGEFQVGFAMIWHGVRISYTQVFQTQQIRQQHGGLHEFGSLALSVAF